jgi:hypothetical protein
MFKPFKEVKINQEFSYYIIGKGSVLCVKTGENKAIDTYSKKEIIINEDVRVKVFD